MKLVRYGDKGQERPGALDADGTLRDLSRYLDDVNAAALAPGSLDRLRGVDQATLPTVPGTPRLGPCIARPGKIVCIGLNYSDHAAEAGQTPPTEPIVFLKATSAMAGPIDDLAIPRDALRVDYEAELAFVVGRQARRVSEGDALAHVAGYCTFNDVTERDWQFERLGQWTKGKNHDGFAPTGPWLVTADEVADPQDLRLRTLVNDEVRQDGTTATMIFGVAEILSYLSRFMTLEPGDLVATGTPPGVAMGMGGRGYLRSGDSVSVEVVGLGRQDTAVVDLPA